MPNVDINTFSKIVDSHFAERLGFGVSKPLALDLLSQTLQILDEFNIQHCLISGTLLGKIRHNDFIPWDDDMDILVDGSLQSKLPDIIEKYHNRFTFIGDLGGYNGVKICFCDVGSEIKTNNHGCKQRIINKNGKYNWPFVDLFVYTTGGDSIRFFDKDWDMSRMIPFIKSDFVGISVNLPQDSDYVLQRNFSPDYMTKLISNWHHHKTETNVNHEEVIDISIEEYNYILKHKRGDKNI